MAQGTTASEDFLSFSLTCEAISSTRSKMKKIEILSNYLRSLGKQSLPIVCRYLSGRIFERASKYQVGLGYSNLTRLILEVSGQDYEELKKDYLALGDLGKAAEVLLEKRAQKPLLEIKPSVLDVHRSLERAAQASSHGAKREKSEIVKGLLVNMTPLEAKYLLKVMAGELRIGLQEGLVEEAVARAFGYDYDSVRKSLLTTGDIGGTAALSKEGKLERFEITPMHPSHFMLANTMESAKEITEYYNREVYVEFKYDGIRTQAHKLGPNVKLFSRRLDDITESFPEIAAALSSNSHDFVIDGEVVPFKDGRPLPFQAIQHRLRRKVVTKDLLHEVPVILFVYDLLYSDSKSVINLGLGDRRRLLESVNLKGISLSKVFQARTEAEVERLFEESREGGFEGLVIKDPNSLYLPGKRGKHWIKLKKGLDTLDVVIVAAEYGHGKRAGVISDYTFAVRDGDELSVIGKAYSGLTNNEIEMMTRRMMELTTEDQGFRRVVKPEVVLEVAFDAIQKSDRHGSGFALRFPRIKRIRFDKPVLEISTLEDVKSIYERQALMKEDFSS